MPHQPKDKLGYTSMATEISLRGRHGHVGIPIVSQLERPQWPLITCESGHTRESPKLSPNIPGIPSNNATLPGHRKHLNKIVFE